MLSCCAKVPLPSRTNQTACSAQPSLPSWATKDHSRPKAALSNVHLQRRLSATCLVLSVLNTEDPCTEGQRCKAQGCTALERSQVFSQPCLHRTCRSMRQEQALLNRPAFGALHCSMGMLAFNVGRLGIVGSTTAISWLCSMSATARSLHHICPRMQDSTAASQTVIWYALPAVINGAYSHHRTATAFASGIALQVACCVSCQDPLTKAELVTSI